MKKVALFVVFFSVTAFAGDNSSGGLESKTFGGQSDTGHGGSFSTGSDDGIEL